MTMQKYVLPVVAAIGVVTVVSVGHAQKQPPPTVQPPNPGVPQIMTLQDHYTRAAYNNDAYAIMSYKVAQYSLGEEYLMLDLGMCMMERTSPSKLKREDITLTLPDNSTLPLPTIAEYRQFEGKVQALQARWKVQKESINYFPPWINGANRLGFFADMGQTAMPWDEVEVSNQRACLGQLYFHVPGGIKYGQHWLNIKFTTGPIRVPFKILTKDEEKLMSKYYSNIKKQIDAAFKKKK